MKTQILAAAHSAACREAMFQAKQDVSEQYEPDPDAPGFFKRVNPTPAKVRAAALNLLAELGLPRCIVEKDEQSDCVSLKPTASGSDSDEEGSWSAWMVFPKAEYLAYCEAYGAEEWATGDGWEEGKACEVCGATTHYNISRRVHKCYECGAYYFDSAYESAKLAEQLGGFSAYSSGPGRPFSHGGWADVGRTRILVKASGGLDI